MAFYTDLNMFTPTDRSLIYDVQSIYQSLTVLLNTRPNDFPFRPEFGVPLDDSLFEIADVSSALEIYRIIVDAVTRYEPRVELDTSRTTITPDPDNNRFDLELYFQIPDLSEESFSFSGAIGLEST